MKISDQWARRRMDKATSVLGAAMPQRILALAWYLQGVQTQDIAEVVGIPVDTLNGLFKRLFRDGLPALEDRRHSASAFLPPTSTAEATQVGEVVMDGEVVQVRMGEVQMRMDKKDPLLCRTVLLALMENGCVEAVAVAEALGLSLERLRKLRAVFRRGGAGALVDQRQGQMQDYAMPARVKAELICHYVEKTQLGESVSAASLKVAVEASGKPCPSAQTLRVHVKKLGLNYIRADESRPLRPKKGLRTS